MHKGWSNIEEVPYCFLKSSVYFQGRREQKNRKFLPELGVSRLYLQFDLTNGYETIHKAWSSTEEVPYCFWR